MLRTFAFILLISILGCSATKKGSSSSQLLFSIEKGPCFGACPEYKVEVFTSGKAVMHAIRNVNQVGEFSTQLSKADLEEISSSLSKLSIEKLDTVYVNKYLTDFPTTDLCFGIKTKVKCIHVCHENPPKEVVFLIQELSRLEKLMHWKEIQDSKMHD